MTGDEKSRAWECAAEELEARYYDLATDADSPVARIAGHVLNVVAPSLRRRAAIIRRNARKGRGKR